MSNIIVKNAWYGDITSSEQDPSRVMDVTSTLQIALNKYSGVVTINNTTMGRDPCFGVVKKIAGTVQLGESYEVFEFNEHDVADFNKLKSE